MPDNIKKISATKQFKRLFAGPIDPSMSWDSMDELKEYLKSPICYPNQILACEGKAYIVAVKDGENVLVEIGTGSGNGGNNGESGGGVECNCDFTDLWAAVNSKANIVHRHDLADIDLTVDGESIIVPGFHIGPEPPSDTSLLWIDTTEKELDTKISSKVLEEFRNTLTGMNSLILELRKEVAELRDHDCGNTLPPITDPSGFYITTEDGFNIVTEDGYVLVSEDFIEGIYDDNYSLVTEDGLYLATEDGYVLVSENFIDNSLLTEDGNYLVTEDGNYIELDNFVAYSNERRVDLRTFLSECGTCATETEKINTELKTKANIDHRHKQTDIDNFPGLEDLTIMSKYHIGPEPPEDSSKLWIDTRNGHVDQTIDMTIINEIKTMITRMTRKINDLDGEIETLRGKYGKNNS